MLSRPIRPLAVLVLGWAALYLPHLAQHETLPARDVAATQIPWRQVWREQVVSGHLPIWDRYSNHGRPFAANPNTMANYPGTLLFLAAEPETAAAWHLALHHLILLFGCYWLARRCGHEAGSAGVAAAAVGTCGVALSLVTFLNAQATFAWAPWALATAVDPPAGGSPRRRRALSGGALLGLAALGGEPVAAILTAVAWMTIVVATWAEDRPRTVILGGVVAFLVASPVLVPLFTVVGDTARGALGASAAAVAADTLALRRLPEMLAPNLLGPPLADGSCGFWARASFPWLRYYPLVFPGGLLLVTLPFAYGRRHLRPWWGLLVAGGSASALLAWPPAARVAHVLFGGGLRFGIKLLLLSALAATPLVAEGWRRLADRWSGRTRKRLLVTGCAVLLLATPAAAPNSVLKPLLGALYPASRDALDEVPGRRLAGWLATDAVLLAAVPITLAVAGPSAPVAAVVAMVANSAAGRGVLLFDRSSRWAEPPSIVTSLGPGARIAPMATAGAAAGGPGDPVLRRFWAYRAALAPNFATRWHGAYALCRGPDGLEPMRQELLAAAAEHLDSEPLARLATSIGATTLVQPAGDPAVRDGIRIIELVAAPEVYVAERLVPCEGVVAAVDTLASPAFRPGQDAVVDGRTPARTLGGGRVTELAGRPDHRRFEVEASGAGLLVVQQSYLRTWRAAVDGTPVTVIPANFAFLGIPVPAGRHLVVLRIDLRPYWLGWCGPLLVALAAVVLRRQRG